MIMHKREQFVLLFYTLFNVISNHFIKFYSDETYYWLWSKKLDFSYFDHPPMVAYLIKLTTLFGDDPLFVRLGAALMVSGTAYLLYALAKKMFDEQVALYTFYIFLSSLLTIVGATLITPDIPMMFFTTLMLYAAYIYIFEDKKSYLLLTGFAAGAAILSKYTGILIIFTLILYVLLYKREVFKEKYLLYAVLIATAVFAPVLYWNYTHDFISFSFQLNHGISEEKVFLAKEFKKFTSAQLVLFHPLYFLPLLYFIVVDKERFEKKKVYLLLPFLFTLGFFTYHAAFKYANAQWSAPAYLTASILLGYYMAKYNMKKLLIAGVALSAFVMVAIKTPLGYTYLKPVEKALSRLGKIDNFQAEIEALHLDMESYDYILVDDYHGSEVAYYFNRPYTVLVLNKARFSNFNIWRYEDLHIAMESPLKEIPHLGKCLYVGREKSHVKELSKLFKKTNKIAYMKKKLINRELEYYFVEFEN